MPSCLEVITVRSMRLSSSSRINVADSCACCRGPAPWRCWPARSGRARAVVGAVVLAVIASGCGSSGTTSSNATSPRATPATVEASQTSSDVGNGSGTDASACHLLSEADVTTAMKQPMKVVGGAGDAICEYAATADPSVILAVQTFATRADAALYTQLETSSEHVDGVGDDAFWNSTLDMVFVTKRDRGFAVTSPSLVNLTGDPQASKAAMVHLATIVLGKF
jgi:hypothetical protein